MYKF
jgi:hypothetical protein